MEVVRQASGKGNHRDSAKITRRKLTPVKREGEDTEGKGNGGKNLKPARRQEFRRELQPDGRPRGRGK